MADIDPGLLLWTDARGHTWELDDMTDSHLENTVRWLRRTADARLEAARDAVAALGGHLQGDMATFYNERDQARLEDEDPLEFLMESEPRYGVMLRAALRRGLPVEDLANEVEALEDYRDAPF